MEKKHLGELTKYLNAVQEQGGMSMHIYADDREVYDFEDILDVDHVANKINICTNMPLALAEDSFSTVMAKAINALIRNVREYGWELDTLHMDIGDMTVSVIEEENLIEKVYNSEKDIWE